MNSEININTLSELLLFLATFYSTYNVSKNHLRISVSIAMASSVVYSIICIPIINALSPAIELYDNRILLPFFAVYFVMYYFATDLPFIRSLVIYLWAIILMLFPSTIASLFDAAIHFDHLTMTFGPDAFAIQLVITIALCIYMRRVVLSWDKNILSPDYTPETLWIGWLSVPILFMGLLIALLPTDYRLLHTFSMSGTYLFFAASLGILYLYLTSIFQSHMSEYVSLQRYKEAQRISEIQRLQFNNLQKQIESDRHARHDFKHTLHLLSQLAASGDTEGLRDYIKKYTAENMDTIVKNYCDNAAINAVLNYYEKNAVSRGIHTTLQVDVKKDIPLSDPEFASLLGNIMENAIDACDETISGEKKFSLSIRVQNDSTLYIVSSNTFDGELLADSSDENTIFSSKKEKHHGIGLKSIRQTVDKYNGTLRISGTDEEFHLDIAISLT